MLVIKGIVSYKVIHLKMNFLLNNYLNKSTLCTQIDAMSHYI